MSMAGLRRAIPLMLFASLLGGFGYGVLRAGPLATTRVTFTTPEYRDLTPALFGIGVVEARRAYAIGPVIAGRVQTVRVDVGDRVVAGQEVAAMEPVDLEARGEAAQAALRRADATLQATEAQMRETVSRSTLAETNASRWADLRRQGFVTQEAVDSRAHEARAATAALNAAQAYREAAAQDRDRLLAEHAAALDLRANLQLHSPIDGVVIARDAEPGSTVVAGQSVLRLIDPDSLWLRVRIDQARSTGLQAGLPADIVLRSYPDARFPGRVARVEWLGDSVTEETAAYVAFDPLPAHLTLGILAEVTLRLPTVAQALTLPNAAVRRQAGQEGVWRVLDDDTLQFQPLRLGIHTLEGAVQVLDDLPLDARIVVHSERELRSGDGVQPTAMPAEGAP